MIVDFTQEKLRRILTAETRVREKLSRVLECMNISQAERNVALNVALCRVRHGGHPATVMNEALDYARRRELEHARRQDCEWYKRKGDGFVPAWDPDGAA